MTFEQSRFQDFFSRCYEVLIYGIYFIAALIFLSFLGVNIDFTFEILLGLAIPALGLVYIYTRFKSGTHLLRIEEQGISFQDDKYVSHIKRGDYEGYNITRLPPQKVVIKNKVFDRPRCVPVPGRHCTRHRPVAARTAAR